MRRELITLLIGAALFGTEDVEAQRARNRDKARDGRNGRVEQLEPIHASGRIAPRTVVYRGGRVSRRNRVVYSSRSRYPAYGRGHVWVRADWGRVRIRSFGHGRGYGFLSQRDLREILGRDTVKMVRDSGRRAGLRGSLRGHWVDQRGRGQLLVLTMDGFDVAEVVDRNGDGFVDDIFLIEARGGRRVVRGR